MAARCRNRWLFVAWHAQNRRTAVAGTARGLSAHDFAQLSAARTVMLTRAKKAGGKPATASRWIIRLKNILNGAHVLEAVDRSEYYARLAERLDEAPYAPVRAEPPRPRVAARPARFSVTRIETPYPRSLLHLWRTDFTFGEA